MREMPPAGAAQPDAATYDAIVSFIENERERSAELNPNPGRPTLHRLNRAEYANAVRDLLALEIDATELLPADDIGYGFDNIGDVLTVSPLLLERYLSAAGKVSRAAIGDTSMPVQFQTYNVPRGLAQIDRMNESMPFGSRGGSSFRHHFPVDGEYVISVKLQTGRFDQILGLERDRKARRADRRRKAGSFYDCRKRARGSDPRRGRWPGCASGSSRAGESGHANDLRHVPQGHRAARRHRAARSRAGLLRGRRQYLGCRALQRCRARVRRPAASGSSSAVRHRRAKSGLARKRSSRRSRAAPIAARSATTIFRSS